MVTEHGQSDAPIGVGTVVGHKGTGHQRLLQGVGHAIGTGGAPIAVVGQQHQTHCLSALIGIAIGDPVANLAWPMKGIDRAAQQAES